MHNFQQTGTLPGILQGFFMPHVGIWMSLPGTEGYAKMLLQEMLSHFCIQNSEAQVPKAHREKELQLLPQPAG